MLLLGLEEMGGRTLDISSCLPSVSFGISVSFIGFFIKL